MKFRCAHCGETADKPTGEVNRARAAGLRLFCGRKCSGLGRRKHKAKAQRVAEKKAYDAEYRRKNFARLKVEKAAWFRRTYDPERQRLYNQRNMPRHVEYCRRPEYKRYKQTYDRLYRAKKLYGPFSEAALAMGDLLLEIKGRMTNEEIRQANQTFNKRQFRAREARQERARTRPRFRDRRDGHSPALG